MIIRNFLTSGFDFSKNEYEEKLHYYLFNSILLIVVFMLLILAYTRFINKEMIQAYIDMFIVIISVVSILILRISKKYEEPVTYTLLVVFFLLVSETFLRKNGSLVGASWYMVFLMCAFFLRGKKTGLISTVFSLLSVFVLSSFMTKQYTPIEYFYVSMPLVSSIIFIILYEKRNLYAKNLLMDKNSSLEIEIEQKTQEKIKLSQQSKELANIIEKSNIELYIMDAETLNFVYVNQGVISELGFSREDLLKMNIFDINPYLTFEDIEELKKVAKDRGANSIQNISIHRRKDGSEYTSQALVQEIKFNNKDAYAVYGNDISEMKKVQKELLHQRDLLEHLAHHDSLTGLPNRVLLLDRLSQAIYRADRNHMKFAVLFLDLDQFKQINDSLGHEIGDLVIKEVANRFGKMLRKEDTFARLGGDEFTIVLENIKSSDDVAALANKLLKNIRKPFIIKNHELYITCSIGISLFPRDAKQVDLLIRNADAAMYRAKESGRNTFNFYTKDMTESAFERVIMETSLRHAINENEFIVYYQPQYNIKTNKIIGVEALARWQHPQAGLIQPQKFIPLAEENGMIIEIDSLIADEAMTQYTKWINQNQNPGKLNLNLTTKQLMHTNFIDDLKNRMKKIRFDPKWLCFEITEGQLMTNTEATIEKLLLLNSIGIEISIDDFGTGYSSLSYLKKLPINQIKIDKSFIDDIPADNESIGIVKAIIALSKTLNLQTIAEGVENTKQQKFLLENGCENAQGYLYSKPLCLKDMTNLLSKKDNLITLPFD
ncbi:MAG: EAL domain-containing protein [Sulfurospirillum sp.]